jgi:hypothetical protein
MIQGEMMRLKSLAVVAAMVMSSAAQAVAPGSLGPATSDYRYQLGLGDGLPFDFYSSESGSGPGAINSNGSVFPAGYFGLVSGYINYGSNPTLSGFVNVNGHGLAAIIASMTYDFRVKAQSQTAYDDLAAFLALNPANGMTLAGHYAVSLSAGSSTDSGSFATINAGFGEVLFQCTPSDASGCTLGSTPYFTNGAVVADTATLSFAGNILLGITARVFDTQSAYAMIDPVISLPQGFMGNPGDYLVQYSPNLNPSAVPEPANWAMLIAGFGLIGTASRRARRRIVPLAG